MEDCIKQSSSSENATVYCDCCCRKTSSTCYKCLACHDFDYCPGCFQKANRIHPGHNFTLSGCSSSDSPSAETRSDPECDEEFQKPTLEICSSCETLSVMLPSFSLAYEEVQEDFRRKIEGAFTKDIEDDMLPNDPELSDRIAEELYRYLDQSASSSMIDLEHMKKIPWDRICKAYEKKLGAGEDNRGDEDEEESDSTRLGIGLAEAMRDSLGSYAPVSSLEYGYEEEDKPRKHRHEDPSRNIAIIWKVRISKLVEATQRGCVFCCFFLHKLFAPILLGRFVGYYGQFDTFTWYTNPEKNAKERQRLVADAMVALTQLKYDRFEFAVLPVCSKKDAKFPDINQLHFKLQNAADDHEVLGEVFKFRGNFHGPGEKPFPLMRFHVDVYTTRDDPAARLITSITPNPSPGSDQGLGLVREWVSQCNENHRGTCCRSPDLQSLLPRRVIDIGDGHNLRLYERSPGEQGCYTALSYCWGGSQGFQTSKSTTDAMISGFTVINLPKTMQDAVAITKAIGVKYIWIDCLCIIQDVPSDKSYEFSQMANIYKGAYLTICATRAESVDDGFLINEADELTGLWRGLVPLNYRVPDSEAQTMQDALSSRAEKGKIWLLDEDELWKSAWSFATARRGWCLQEHILSPRFLSYGRWPTWRCRKATWTDGGYYHSSSNMRDDTETLENRLVDMIFDETTQSEDCSPGFDVFRMTQLYQAWYALVHDYSKRKIGHSCDILPAIGGLAAEFSRLTGHQYLAGLWDKNILHDLMWFTKVREWSRRTPEWRAPSWSWASVDAVITYGKITADSKPLSTVRRCTVTPKDPLSIFGEVSMGNIEIRGPFSSVKAVNVNGVLKEQAKAPARPKVDREDDWFSKMMNHVVDSSGTNHVNPETHKVDDSPVLEDPVYALITFSRDWTFERNGKRVKDICYSGLFLCKAESHDILECYQRVGMFANESKEWLDQKSVPWNEESVVII